MLRFKTGDRVIYSGGDQDECGVVIHVWTDEYGDQDCYVAFFGEAFPEGAPEAKPYVLRYHASSLRKAV